MVAKLSSKSTLRRPEFEPMQDPTIATAGNHGRAAHRPSTPEAEILHLPKRPNEEPIVINNKVPQPVVMIGYIPRLSTFDREEARRKNHRRSNKNSSTTIPWQWPGKPIAPEDSFSSSMDLKGEPSDEDFLEDMAVLTSQQRPPSTMSVPSIKPSDEEEEESIKGQPQETMTDCQQQHDLRSSFPVLSARLSPILMNSTSCSGDDERSGASSSRHTSSSKHSRKAAGLMGVSHSLSSAASFTTLGTHPSLVLSSDADNASIGTLSPPTRSMILMASPQDDFLANCMDQLFQSLLPEEYDDDNNEDVLAAAPTRQLQDEPLSPCSCARRQRQIAASAKTKEKTQFSFGSTTSESQDDEERNTLVEARQPDHDEDREDEGAPSIRPLASVLSSLLSFPTTTEAQSTLAPEPQAASGKVGNKSSIMMNTSGSSGDDVFESIVSKASSSSTSVPFDARSTKATKPRRRRKKKRMTTKTTASSPKQVQPQLPTRQQQIAKESTPTVARRPAESMLLTRTRSTMSEGSCTSQPNLPARKDASISPRRRIRSVDLGPGVNAKGTKDKPIKVEPSATEKELETLQPRRRRGAEASPPASPAGRRKRTISLNYFENLNAEETKSLVPSRPPPKQEQKREAIPEPKVVDAKEKHPIIPVRFRSVTYGTNSDKAQSFGLKGNSNEDEGGVSPTRKKKELLWSPHSARDDTNDTRIEETSETHFSLLRDKFSTELDAEEECSNPSLDEAECKIASHKLESGEANIEDAATDSDNDDDRSVNWKWVMGNSSTKSMSESDEDGPNGVAGMRLLHEEVLGMDSANGQENMDETERSSRSISTIDGKQQQKTASKGGEPGDRPSSKEVVDYFRNLANAVSAQSSDDDDSLLADLEDHPRGEDVSDIAIMDDSVVSTDMHPQPGTTDKPRRLETIEEGLPASNSSDGDSVFSSEINIEDYQGMLQGIEDGDWIPQPDMNVPTPRVSNLSAALQAPLPDSPAVSVKTSKSSASSFFNDADSLDHESKASAKSCSRGESETATGVIRLLAKFREARTRPKSPENLNDAQFGVLAKEFLSAGRSTRSTSSSSEEMDDLDRLATMSTKGNDNEEEKSRLFSVSGSCSDDESEKVIVDKYASFAESTDVKVSENCSQEYKPNMSRSAGSRKSAESRSSSRQSSKKFDSSKMTTNDSPSRLHLSVSRSRSRENQSSVSSMQPSFSTVEDSAYCTDSSYGSSLSNGNNRQGRLPKAVVAAPRPFDEEVVAVSTASHKSKTSRTSASRHSTVKETISCQEENRMARSSSSSSSSPRKRLDKYDDSMRGGSDRKAMMNHHQSSRDAEESMEERDEEAVIATSSQASTTSKRRSRRSCSSENQSQSSSRGSTKRRHNKSSKEITISTVEKTTQGHHHRAQECSIDIPQSGVLSSMFPTDIRMLCSCDSTPLSFDDGDSIFYMESASIVLP